MVKAAKLIQAARDRPQNLRFAELCALAEAYGFEWVHGRGSHRVYAHDGVVEILVL